MLFLLQKSMAKFVPLLQSFQWFMDKALFHNWKMVELCKKMFPKKCVYELASYESFLMKKRDAAESDGMGF